LQSILNTSIQKNSRKKQEVSAQMFNLARLLRTCYLETICTQMFRNSTSSIKKEKWGSLSSICSVCQGLFSFALAALAREIVWQKRCKAPFLPNNLSLPLCEKMRFAHFFTQEDISFEIMEKK
jgi:hypothetical protein